MIEEIAIIIAFVLSVLCGFLLIPRILIFCKNKRIYDIPNQRKLHRTPVPRLGGIVFMPSMLISFIIAITILGWQSNSRHISISLWTLYFIISLLIIYFIGVVDDLIGLGARSKFLAQIIAASLLPASGLYINNLYGFLGIQEIPFGIGAPLTVFVIVFIDNALNLIDGIDGLSASLSFIALTGFGICYAVQGLFAYCILIAGLAGILIPYMYYNVLGKAENNTKIFMGDSGSLTLGFFLGFLFVKYIMVNELVMPYQANRLILSYSLLIIPIFDVVRIIFYRLRHHKPLFDADKNHIHHKLMNMGLTMHQTLGTIVALVFVFIALNALIYPFVGITWVVLVNILVYTLVHLGINCKIKKNKTI